MRWSTSVGTGSLNSEPLDTRGVRNSCAAICAILLLVPILYKGHAGIVTVATIDGFISALAWFASAFWPLYHEPARRWQAVSLALNSVAAAATAGVVVSTMP